MIRDYPLQPAPPESGLRWEAFANSSHDPWDSGDVIRANRLFYASPTCDARITFFERNPP